MAKPTSLAAQLRRTDEETQRANNKEDARFVAEPPEEGKVWVRLRRQHYDSNNVLHQPGIVQLYEDAVPSSAKILTAVQVAAEKDAED